ncbi:MAG: multiple sugar transport system substrate-binding protein [Actinomycetota bacterium]|nr:multiple sugar transport system substrate-binding protein [Actinomycetota bacterium]
MKLRGTSQVRRPARMSMLAVTVAALVATGCTSKAKTPVAANSSTPATASASSSAATPAGSSTPAATGSAASTAAGPTLDPSTKATITFWTWVKDMDKEVALFNQKYPNIKVNVVNAGQGGPEYTKLQTALKAGTGAPDVAQIEYQYIPTFTTINSLVDLVPFGANDVKSAFVDWTWSQVAKDGKVFAIPQDTGPMGMLYRQDLFDKYGISVPKTWDEFAADAKKLHAADPSVYLTDLPPNEAGAYVGLEWQAGARPFDSQSATSIGVSLNDASAKKVADYWGGLVTAGAVATDPDFTNAWYQGLATGRYATWLTAAWGPLFLQGTAKDTAGKWRAAPLPQWSAGDQASGNWGGSTTAVIKQTKSAAAAAAFAIFLNTDPQSASLLNTDQSLVPATKALLGDSAFLGQKLDFYGGQTVNQTFADISSTVASSFQWSPFQDFVFSQFNGTVGTALTKKQDVAAGLDAWQAAVVKYAKQQGFTVAGG